MGPTSSDLNQRLLRPNVPGSLGPPIQDTFVPSFSSRLSGQRHPQLADPFPRRMLTIVASITSWAPPNTLVVTLPPASLHPRNHTAQHPWPLHKLRGDGQIRQGGGPNLYLMRTRDASFIPGNNSSSLCRRSTLDATSSCPRFTIPGSNSSGSRSGDLSPAANTLHDGFEPLYSHQLSCC